MTEFEPFGQQLGVPAVIMRSGTSKGIYLNEADLPPAGPERDKLILRIFGSPDPRQIDGLGGADILTSKLAIVGKCDRDDADITYTFGQVVIDRPLIQYAGLCGNISAGVAPFAIDEGLVEAVEPATKVRVWNTNTQQIFEITVPVVDGHSAVYGDFAIDGVNGTGAKLDINMAKTMGSYTGKLLPTGNASDKIEVNGKTYEVSIVDVVNPCVFVKAAELGLTGVEAPPDMAAYPEVLETLADIRKTVAGMIGFSTKQEDLDADARPMCIFVGPSKDYKNYLSGEPIAADEADFAARCFMISGKTRDMHQAFPGSISVAVGAACRIPGTVVNQASSSKGRSGVVRVGHPLGKVEVEAEVAEDGELLVASYSRTARRIMKGIAYVPDNTL